MQRRGPNQNEPGADEQRVHQGAELVRIERQHEAFCQSRADHQAGADDKPLHHRLDRQGVEASEDERLGHADGDGAQRFGREERTFYKTVREKERRVDGACGGNHPREKADAGPDDQEMPGLDLHPLLQEPAPGRNHGDEHI